MFSIWVRDSIFGKMPSLILQAALEWQQAEPKFEILPKCHLCDAPHWYANGDNYGAVVRQQSLHTNK